MPGDTKALRPLAEAAMRQHNFGEAAQYYRKAAAAEPANSEVLNELAYALAFNQDLAGAMQAIEEYRKRNPKNPNSFDTSAEINYYFGDFAAAEKEFLKAAQADPAFLGGAPLLKAALARVMTGDVSGADEHFKRFLEVRKSTQDPTVEYRLGQWEYLTGRRKQGQERLERVLQAGSETGAIAGSQLAMWSLEAGDSAAARAYAQQGAALAKSPGARNVIGISLFLAQPPASAAEWKARGDRIFANPALAVLKKQMVAYALLLSKQFTEAVPLLQELHKATPPHDVGQIKVLLAWALTETGRAGDAWEYIRNYPIPESTGFDPMSHFVYPRVLQVRAAALEKQGKKDEAQANFKLFQRLSGR